MCSDVAEESQSDCSRPTTTKFHNHITRLDKIHGNLRCHGPQVFQRKQNHVLSFVWVAFAAYASQTEFQKESKGIIMDGLEEQRRKGRAGRITNQSCSGASKHYVMPGSGHSVPTAYLSHGDCVQNLLALLCWRTLVYAIRYLLSGTVLGSPLLTVFKD